MKPSLILVIAAALTAPVAAQTTANPVNSFLSEVYSVYTEVTSILASAAGATSTTSSSSSSTDSSSSSSTSSSTTISSISTSSSASAGALASSTSPSSTLSSPSSTGSSAAASSSAAAATSHGSHPNILAIVLGTVFGILALILLLLLILLCCRKRRRSSRRNRDVVSPEDAEIDSWRHESKTGPDEPMMGDLSRSQDNIGTGVAAAPVMAERSVHRPSGPENPFVPVVPPPRRTAPNSRVGLTDGAIPGQEPFVTDPKTGTPDTAVNGLHNGNHHKGEAVAAGLGGAALGAIAIHHHNEKDVEKADQTMEHYPAPHEPLDRGHGIARKPVPSFPISPIDRPFSPYMLTTMTPSETSGSDQYPIRRSEEIPRPSHLNQQIPPRNEPAGNSTETPDDSTQHNAQQSTITSPVPTYSSVTSPPIDTRHGNDSHEPLVAGAAGLGAGALAGGALARHHERKQSKSRSPQRRRTGNYDAAKIGNRSSSSDYSSASYEDAMPGRSNDRLADNRIGTNVPTDIPPPPQLRSRRNSTLGTAAPPAALGSYQNTDLPPAAQQSAQHHHEVPVPPLPAAVATGAGGLGGAALVHGRRNGNGNPNSSPGPGPANYRRRDQTPPSIPSRSPKRTRFSDVPFDEQPPYDLNNNQASYRQPPGRSITSSPDEDIQPAVPRGLVGPDRYPHMGLASRRPGDDFDSIVPIRQQGGPPERESSDDSSTWRLSEGMPGGWRREKSRDRTAPRPLSSPGPGTSTTTPMTMRDSGIGSSSSGLGSNRGSRSNSMTDSNGNGNGRRLRLADLRREEEEREIRDRGRKSMENEWVGNGGYDGYDHYHPMDGSFVGGVAPHAGGGDVGRAL